MFDVVNTSDSLPVVSLLPTASALDFSCLDGRVTSHPVFSSGYEHGYDLYFDVESGLAGDIVYGVPVTAVSVAASISRSLLESDYSGELDLFFWLGASAGFLAALALYHWKEAQVGLGVLASLAGVVLSEVLGC